MSVVRERTKWQEEIIRARHERRAPFNTEPEYYSESAKEFYKSQVELEKHRAKAEFEKRLREMRRQARVHALQEFYRQIQRQRMELIAQLAIQERKAIKAAPFNVRRLIAQQYQQRRMKALEEFKLHVAEATKEFMLKLESELEKWEKSQRQQFQINIQKWEEQTWKDIEKQLQTSLEKAIASVPKGAKIKEVKFEEGAWKISYEVKQEQVTLPKTIEQPKTWTEQFAESFITPFEIGIMIGEKITGKTIPKEMKEQVIPPVEKGMKSTIIGVSASFESLLKGMGHFSIEAFVKGPGKEFVPPTELQSQTQKILHEALGPSPPTLSGAATSSLISRLGVDVGADIEWAKLAEMERKYPGYMAGTLMGDIAISWMFGEAFGRLWQKIRGGKVTKLVGGVEDERIFIEKGRLVSIRKIKPIFKTERISFEEYRYLKELTRYFQPKRVELYGEKLLAPTWKKWPLPARAFHPPEPFFAAAKQVPSYGVKSYGYLFGERMIKIWQFTSEKFKLPTITEKIIVRSPAFKAPAKMVSTRIYTLAYVAGEIDKQVYLNFLKNVPVEVGQKWLKQMGAVSPFILRKAPSSTVPVVTQILKVELQTPSLIEKMIAGFTLKSLISAPAFKAKPTIKTPIKTEINIKAFSLPAINIKTIPKTGIKLLPKLKLEHEETLKQSLESETIPKITLPLPLPKLPSEFKLPKPKRRKRKKPVGFYGWIGLEVPVPSAKQILKFVLGGKKSRRKR